jgi:hypothetical protein
MRSERFFKPQMINGRMAASDGPIKTFPLRGIKDSPPYLHDGRLLTLEDTVEFFNLMQQLNLSSQEKKDLVEFMRALWRSPTFALNGSPGCLLSGVRPVNLWGEAFPSISREFRVHHP